MNPDDQQKRHSHELIQLRDIESKLQNNEDRLYQAIEAAQLGIWDWYVIEDRLVWDTQMLELAGITREEFTDNSHIFYERMHPDDVPYISKAVKKALSTCSKFEATYRFKTDENMYVSIVSKGNVMCDEEGYAYRIIGVSWRASECPRYTSCPVRIEAESKMRAGAHLPDIMALKPSSL